MKGELVRATVTWKQAHIGCSYVWVAPAAPQRHQGDGGPANGINPSAALTLLCPRNSIWMMSRGMSVRHRRSPFLCVGPSIYMATLTSEGAVCRSTCLLSQHRAPSCPLPLYQLPHMEVTPRLLLLPICLRNLSAHPIVILAKVVVGRDVLANWVPPVVLQMGTSGESTCGPWKDWILEELNLQGLEEWPKEEQDQARKCWSDGNTCLPTVTWTCERHPSSSTKLS